MKRYFLLIALALGCAAATQAQITAPIQEAQAPSENPDAKYLVPLPLEPTGQVYLERVITLPEGTNTEETLTKLKDWMDRCMKDSRIISSIPVETDEPNTLQMMVNQEIIFSQSFLALDNGQLNYLLQVGVKDGKIDLQMRRISFRYNGDNPDRKMLRISAEEYIADKVALNKKGDKILRAFRKFRVKTVDLIDEYESSLKMAFWLK